MDGVLVFVFGVLGILNELLDCVVEFRDILFKLEVLNNCDILKDEKDGFWAGKEWNERGDKNEFWNGLGRIEDCEELWVIDRLL